MTDSDGIFTMDEIVRADVKIIGEGFKLLVQRFDKCEELWIQYLEISGETNRVNGFNYFDQNE